MNICAFPFFNEIEIVEVKLATLRSVIDRFVVVESDMTFAGRKRALMWEELVEANPFIKSMKNQIVYLPLAVYLQRHKFTTPWEVEAYTRNYLIRGLNGIEDNAVIFLTDADEIPDAYWTIKAAERIREDRGRVDQPYMARHCYYVNWRAPKTYAFEQLTCAFSIKKLEKQTMNDICRNHGAMSISVRPGAGYGWHFGWLGGRSAILKKLRSFSHTELNSAKYANVTWVKNRLKDGKDLFERDHLDTIRISDGELPSYLVKNKERFSKLWSPDARKVGDEFLEHEHDWQLEEAI